jgi:hypothetical protein
MQSNFKSREYQNESDSDQTIIPEEDIFLISFPKSGRTWLRLLLGKVFTLHFDIDIANINLLLLDELALICSDIPKINVTHDDNPHWKKIHELSASKMEYIGKKVIFLVRDPRDIIISNYFEKTRREQMYYIGERQYQGDLSSYLYSDTGSLKTLINFYNIWADNRYIPCDFLMIRYEDMLQNTKQELLKILEFINLGEISDDIINQAIYYASFENMRKLEIKNFFKSFILRPGNQDDPESYKTRKGKMGGFIDYLSEVEIQWIDCMIIEQLSSFYSCYKYSTRLSTVSELN